MKIDNIESVLETGSKDKWQRIGLRRRAGVLAPLFHVYSEKSAGIGDLGDLKILIDWCSETGNSILELLPMNEVGPTFCPYDSLSSFALEPSYVSLASIDGVDDKFTKAAIKVLLKKYPNNSRYVDYGIKSAKIKILRDLYRKEFQGESKAFEKFKEENSYWLEDFALYKVIKAKEGGKPWYEWSVSLRDRLPRDIEDFKKNNSKDLAFEAWLQYELYRQLKDARLYAKSKNVLMAGDLPILVSRDSADVWAHREYFKLDFAAGAPPDMYCAKGQRWGVPTYEWPSQERDGYKYLKEKLKFAQELYDILRIDHVVGLFRIWSIPYREPEDNKGLNGFFDPKNENSWKDHGRNLLSVMLENTDMLLVAEDLGIIPKDCPATMKEAGIPGNDIERWTKDWVKSHDFLGPDKFRELSVSIVSTHDTTNACAWWENEAGTVDEALFKRLCSERGINYDSIKDGLFDFKHSGHGRLKWQNGVSSVEEYVSMLGKRAEEVKDFIEMYENTYKEKEKLWKRLGLKGRMKEKCDSDIAAGILNIAYKARSIFSIQLITDLTLLGGILKGDPYQYRINTPGTVSDKNWSLRMPISLEELSMHPVSKKISKMIEEAGRR